MSVGIPILLLKRVMSWCSVKWKTKHLPSVYWIVDSASNRKQWGNVDKDIPSQKSTFYPSLESNLALPWVLVVVCDVEHEYTYANSSESCQSEKYGSKVYPIVQSRIQSSSNCMVSFNWKKSKDNISVQGRRRDPGREWKCPRSYRKPFVAEGWQE